MDGKQLSVPEIELLWLRMFLILPHLDRQSVQKATPLIKSEIKGIPENNRYNVLTVMGVQPLTFSSSLANISPDAPRHLSQNHGLSRKTAWLCQPCRHLHLCLVTHLLNEEAVLGRLAYELFPGLACPPRERWNEGVYRARRPCD